MKVVCIGKKKVRPQHLANWFIQIAIYILIKKMIESIIR